MLIALPFQIKKSCTIRRCFLPRLVRAGGGRTTMLELLQPVMVVVLVMDARAATAADGAGVF
ncbi:MAG: hypothetical protein ABS45_05710 [Comamonas sp. SCN 65-56]|nr:MAG: hypothetical protein ABS45_05710 [Comamonas sp. SCN 65-56]